LIQITLEGFDLLFLEIKFYRFKFLDLSFKKTCPEPTLQLQQDRRFPQAANI
jgi:hypothetical protein